MQNTQCVVNGVNVDGRQVPGMNHYPSPTPAPQISTSQRSSGTHTPSNFGQHQLILRCTITDVWVQGVIFYSSPFGFASSHLQLLRTQRTNWWSHHLTSSLNFRLGSAGFPVISPPSLPLFPRVLKKVMHCCPTLLRKGAEPESHTISLSGHENLSWKSLREGKKKAERWEDERFIESTEFENYRTLLTKNLQIFNVLDEAKTFCQGCRIN